MAYHNGVLSQYGIYPRGIYFAELLFFPAYIVVMFTVSASFLYNRIDNERWKTIGAPAVCAVLVVTNVVPINFVDAEFLLYGLSFLSFLSLLGLPQMYRRLVHSLGEAGHVFIVPLAGPPPFPVRLLQKNKETASRGLAQDRKLTYSD